MTAESKSYLREGMHSVNPYLVVRGADQLMDFIIQVFGGEQRLRVPGVNGKVQHAEMRIGDMVLELADGNETHPPAAMALHIYVPDVDAAYGKALQAVVVPLHAPTDQPYGDREASVRHASGITWYIATHKGASYQREGLWSVTPYLHPKGSGELIEFVKQAFDAVVGEIHHEADGTVAHAKIRIGDSTIELGETHGEWAPMSANLHVYVPDADATYQRALDAGAKSQQSPVDTPYGDRGAGVVDRWGNQWWIATYIGA